MSQIFALAFSFLILFLFAVPFIFNRYNPITITNITYTASDSYGDIEKLPAKFSTGNVPDKWIIEFDMYIPLLVWFLPQNYKIIPDDCLIKLQINGSDFISPSIPFCAFPRGHHINLRHLVKPGENHVVAHIDNRYGGATSFNIKPDFNTKIVQSAGFIPFIALMIFYGFFRLRSDD